MHIRSTTAENRRSHRSGSARLALMAVVMLSAFMPSVGTPSSAEARNSRDLPLPSAFTLSPSTFPPGSVVRGGRATESTLESASGLHTVSLAMLGHLVGYLETAWWWPPSTTGGPRPLASIQYMASIFSSSNGAAASVADAQASLWELGYPLHNTVATSRPFAVTERDGHSDVYLLLRRGPIELELRLRYDRSIDGRSRAAGLWYLLQAGRAVWTRAGRLARTLPEFPRPAAPNPLPEISVAPWGTGPIVKSPSLMTLDGTQPAEGTPPDPGAFRPDTHGLPLPSQAIRHARIVPLSGLARYVTTASLGGRSGWYGSTSLYRSPDEAHGALLSLSHANRYHSWLPPYPLNPLIWHTGSLSVVDESRSWQVHGETIFVFRVQNVLLVLAEVGQVPRDATTVVAQVVKTIPTWLHVEGTTIVSAGGDPVHLASVNWYGAEENDFVVGGLDFQPYQAILQKIKLLGFNSIRLPYSNEMVERNPVVNAHMAANAKLQGLHALDILDRIIDYAGALGLLVILDDHRSDAGWSTQADGLWYSKDYPEAAFNRDWVTLAHRYGVNNVVVGADLRNEPHAKVSWGDGNVLTDWHAAAQRAGDGALAANPHLLIIVEGIQNFKNRSYWWGGSLMGVQDAPVVLNYADGSSARSQLVYSVHDYGPDNCGNGCPWFNKATTYQSLTEIWEQYWGYIVDDPTKPYAAPVFVGEFGTCNTEWNCVGDTTPGSQGEWFSSLVQYIAEKHLGWGYWSINGTRSTGGSRVYGTVEGYGFLDHAWSVPYPWLETGLHSILAAVPGEAVQRNQGSQGGWAIDNKGGVAFARSLSSQLDYMQKAGMGWVRLTFRLGTCFTDWTTPGCTGMTALATYDQVVQNALDHKLQILGLLSNESWRGKQTDWTANNAENTSGNGDNPYIANLSQKAAGILAAHFGSRVSQWEVWNEPNAWTASAAPGVYSGGTFLYPSNFAWLLARTYRAIKDADSSATVISGGISSRDADTGAAYLFSTYKMGITDAGWAAGAYPLDGIGQHLHLRSYGIASSRTLNASLQAVREAYLTFEGPRTSKPTYVTEVGWSTGDVSPAVQSQNLQSVYTLVQSTGYVGRAYWSSVQDSWDTFYGLVDANGVHKPAFTAYQQYAGF